MIAYNACLDRVPDKFERQGVNEELQWVNRYGPYQILCYLEHCYGQMTMVFGINKIFALVNFIRVTNAKTNANQGNKCRQVQVSPLCMMRY